jgi:Holliday junction resolvase RusA-like endonuclease
MSYDRMPRQQTLEIRGQLPTLNEILAAQSETYYLQGRNGRAKRVSTYSRWKRDYTNMIVAEIMRQKLVPVVNYPIRLAFHTVRRDRRTDPDNIVAGVHKFVIDALKEAGIIRNDGWNEIELPFIDSLEADAYRTRVEVEIIEPDALSGAAQDDRLTTHL